jgi:hypothetical protein
MNQCAESSSEIDSRPTQNTWVKLWISLCIYAWSLQGMVPDAGVEPATFGLQNRCSTN